ncbi:MAG: alpha-L-arabinofuranosidase C-terminal domain-containing protein [Bacteroidota bacterium]
MKTHTFLSALVFSLSLGIQAQPKESKLVVNVSDTGVVISKDIYGHFAEHLGTCIYGGIWVGEKSSIPNTRGIRNDVVAALKKIHAPAVRWPGGCFADGYHWMEGIGPRDKRPKLVNTTWGGVTEDNSFGTHEFMDFCEQIGAEPYICGNIGSGTVKEMADWVQYLTSDGETPMAELRKMNGRDESWKVRYWAMGNETWGCGGIMSADYYANEMAKYSYSLKNYGKTQLYKVASGGLPEDYNWTETIMKKWSAADGWLQGFLSGYSLHFYAVNDWNKKGSATNFNEADWFASISKNLEIDELIAKHSAIMDKHDSLKKIGLVVDEWGNWFDVEPGTNPSFLYQQNTMRDAVTAAVNLNIFNNHADRVKMANIAQLVNVLQSLILTDGPKMVLTPTYHVFDLFKVHQNAKLLPVKLEATDYELGGKKIPAVNCSASIDETGKIHISLVNTNYAKPQDVSCSLEHFTPGRVTGQILVSEEATAHNTFENPNAVSPAKFTGVKVSGQTLKIHLPSKCVVVLEIEGELSK